MKKRIILASTVALSLAPTLATQAEEIVWSPRTVEQIQNDVAKSENKTSYTIKVRRYPKHDCRGFGSRLKCPCKLEQNHKY